MEKGIAIVLLSYCEEENLRVLLPEIKQVMQQIDEDYDILVVDTMKALDDTADVCSEHGAIYINQEEPMFGGAFRTAIKYTQREKFLIMDSDGSHRPKYIPAMYKKFCEGYDVVIGSRYIGGGSTNDSPSSVIMSKCLNLAFRVCLGINAKDMSNDFRIYRTELLKQVSLECDVYDVLEEVLLKLKLLKDDLKIGEVPISFNKRLFGESKRKLVIFIIRYIKALFRLTALRISHKLKKN